MRSALPRWLLSILLLLAAAAVRPAQAEGARRTVLVEFFCTQGCQWAETAAAALDRVADEFGPDQLLAVEYNLDRDGDLFERRFHLYVPPGTHVPFAFFDGARLGIYGSNNDVEESYGWYRDAALTELAAISPLRLESAAYLTDRSATFEVRLTNASAAMIEPADLYLGLYEQGKIGRTHRLLRYLSPPLPVAPLAPGESRLIAHQAPPLAADVDLAHVHGLAFVQRPSDNAILQATPAVEPWLALRPPSLAAVMAIGSAASPSPPIVVDGLGAPFHWTLETPSSPWLSAAPAAGGRGEPFTVTLDPAGLAAGVYRDRLAVRTDGPLGPKVSDLNVTLYVAERVSTVHLPLLGTRGAILP